MRREQRRKSEGKGETPEWGSRHYKFEIPREQLQTAVNRVRSHGVDISGPLKIGRMEGLVYLFQDPAGNLLEFWSSDR